ncbi:MAG: VOC family protein [Gammaproteobacteria bacterium]|nr:VOC family protein [Gammaproteobacteria bacterium]
MPLERLDHYFVYASDLEVSKRFYSEVLGLTSGPRPQFGFPGYWFYLDDRPVVHIGDDGFEGGYVYENGEHVISGPTGPVDHIAFRASNIDDFLARFDRLGVSFQRREVPDFRLSQLFVKDPEGLTIELNFFHD